MKKSVERLFNRLHHILLSDETKHKSERFILSIAIISFIMHLLLIGLVDFGILAIKDYSKLLNNPIAAIYTPFSFILIYEVYLLVYYLPTSISIYIAKQYEIITLIIIRRIFKDLSNLEFTPNWFQNQGDLQFTYDITATVLLFLLIYVFYWLNGKNERKWESHDGGNKNMSKFITQKKWIATALVPTFLLLALYRFSTWFYGNFISLEQMVDRLRDVNNIFFDEFFTILIMTDVLLLLISFVHRDKFNKVIRNSGFIISTILIRLSFGVDGLLSTVLIVVAVLFGVIILAIHNLYENLNHPAKL